MKKRVMNVLMVLAMSFALAACGADKDKGNTTEPTNTVAPTETPDAGNSGGDDTGSDEGAGGNEDGGADQGSGERAKAGTSRFVIDSLVSEADRPAFIEVEEQMLKDMYKLDASLFQDYVVLTPMMNISTTEYAVFQVKDAKDIPAVEEGIKQRAEAVQKSFEEYLPDQYENAKNYKLVTKGNFVLFTIAKDAADVVDKFNEIVK